MADTEYPTWDELKRVCEASGGMWQPNSGTCDLMGCSDGMLWDPVEGCKPDYSNCYYWGGCDDEEHAPAPSPGPPRRAPVKKSGNGALVAGGVALVGLGALWYFLR